MRTVDDLKLERDGHLEYGTVQSKDHAWVRPVFPTVAYYLDSDGKPVGELRGSPGFGSVGYGKETHWRVTPEEYEALLAERGQPPHQEPK
jgi:hypothetical protein